MVEIRQLVPPRKNIRVALPTSSRTTALQLAEPQKISHKFYEMSFKEVKWTKLAKKHYCDFVIIIISMWVAQ
jgi:hypothetical protein